MPPIVFHTHRARRALSGSTAVWAGLFLIILISSTRAVGAAGDSAGADNPSPHLTDTWFGFRQDLAKRGVDLDLTLTADFTKNLSGGLDTAGSTWRRLVDASASLDTETLLHLKGGTIYAEFQSAVGPNASDELVGDAQGIDGLDGVPGTKHQNRMEISQFWYQQTLMDGAVRIKIGKVDANTEFDSSPIAQEFLHQSTGASATLFTLPTYPDPAMGINLFVKPRQDLQVGFGVYDGSSADGVRTGELGPPATFFRGANDLFLIAEIDKSWSIGRDRLAGRAAIGGWFSTNHFARLDTTQASGTGGPYALVEQALWRAAPMNEDDARGISVFLMYGYADPTILAYDHNIGGGISWAGPISSRPDDILGLGVQAIHFSEDYHPRDEYEAAYEVFYRLQLKPWFFVKPDLQYIANPSGNGTADAFAVTVRLQLEF